MTSTYSHAFSCDISQAVYHPEVIIPAHGVLGYYDNPGAGDCGGLTPAHHKWGEDIGACIFTQTGDAEDEQITQAFNDPAAFVVNEAGVAINQSQTDSDVASFEEHGGIVQVSAEYYVGQAVICNSPGSKGGTWRVQNGYNGGSFTGPAAGCNTPYFKIAPWGNGSQTSNGTFTSVPNYSL